MRRRLSYANVTATLALVFAMSGGAMAANHYLINSTKQISPKVLKKLKGNAGKTGASGPAGATGPGGAAGPQGKEGPAGKEGGTGKEGKVGEPGPLVSEVPSGKTITGSWGTYEHAAGAELYGAYGNFPFPLPSLPTVVFLGVGKTEPTHCPGTPESPKAASGYLCIYRGYELDVSATAPTIGNHFGTQNGKGDVYGFLVQGTASAAGILIDEGTWAYTAP